MNSNKSKLAAPRSSTGFYALTDDLEIEFEEYVRPKMTAQMLLDIELVASELIRVLDVSAAYNSVTGGESVP